MDNLQNRMKELTNINDYRFKQEVVKNILVEFKNELKKTNFEKAILIDKKKHPVNTNYIELINLIDKYIKNDKYYLKFTPENIIDYSEDGLLRIKIKHIKTTLNGVYNEVWVNGNKLLPRHINTEIKLFCDDTVLAIHGILENNSDYPSTPMWLVYDTNLRLRLPKSRNIFSGYYVYAKSVHQLLDMMRLDIDNKTQIYFRNDLMKKIAEGKKFVLEKVK